jgi:excisionase family DNA binding protein
MVFHRYALGVPPDVVFWLDGLRGSEDRMDRLLTVDQVGELLNTGPRFVRRLIAERRIEFVHVGRHVRISESALLKFVEAGSVPVMPIATGRRS